MCFFLLVKSEEQCYAIYFGILPSSELRCKLKIIPQSAVKLEKRFGNTVAWFLFLFFILLLFIFLNHTFELLICLGQSLVTVASGILVQREVVITSDQWRFLILLSIAYMAGTLFLASCGWVRPAKAF